ncbi:glycosyltransferase family 2 protein [Methylopila henanensis]|uniref:Glycosyltransferase family 2 protein n=1 Tax=Methylopila henanensis TaxID=873516 RepID=A0ABW4KBU2_9HYPH
MDLVSIVIPTLNRPEPLRRAVASALAQQGADVGLEVLVVDNSADGNAAAVVSGLAGPADRPVRYLAAPRPGVANARNAGVAAAAGRWVAFLDDDQEASVGWVAAHVAAARASGADATFGPVEGRAEDGASMGPFEPYFSRRIERPDADDVTAIAAYLGTNNSMFDRARCLSDDPPFDPRLNESGGEDSLLLKRLTLAGRRLGWAAGATVIEWTPERRLTWAYVRKRKFLSGQVRTFTHHMVSPPQWGRIAFWMAAGVAQCLAAGAAAAAFAPIDRERSQKALAAAYGGLGKVLWAERFRPSLYGPGLVS